MKPESVVWEPENVAWLKMKKPTPASSGSEDAHPSSESRDEDSIHTEETVGDTPRQKVMLMESPGVAGMAKPKFEAAAINAFEEVGNFGVYAINCGQRLLDGSRKRVQEKKQIRKRMDEQFMKSPGW